MFCFFFQILATMPPKGPKEKSAKSYKTRTIVVTSDNVAWLEQRVQNLTSQLNAFADKASEDQKESRRQLEALKETLLTRLHKREEELEQQIEELEWAPIPEKRELTLLKDKHAKQNACMAQMRKEMEDWSPFPETAELNRLKVAYAKDKECWELKHQNLECLVQVACLQKEAWEDERDSLDARVDTIAGANKGLAEGLIQASREKDFLQELNINLRGLNTNLEGINKELQVKIERKVELNNMIYRQSILKDEQLQLQQEELNTLRERLRVKQEEVNVRIGLNETFVHRNRALTSTVNHQQDELERLYAIVNESSEWDKVLLEEDPSRPTTTIDAADDLE